MTLKNKGLLIYIKILLLIVLVGGFYWRDFFAFWQTAVSAGWVIFTLVILFLVFVFLFQRRNALKTLISISENHNGQGAGFVFLALVLYVVGSYTPHALWLHLCSLILFIAGYLALMIDFRIPRMLFFPLVALVFVIPPIEIEAFAVQNLPTLFALYLSVNAVIVVLAVYIVRERAHNNEIKAAYCPLCRSDMFKEEVFCFHCGRQHLSPEVKPFRFTFMKFLVLLLIVLVLSFVYLPTLSLTDQKASFLFYTPHGIEEPTMIPSPDGWKLESIERLVDYEREHLEDFAVLSTYALREFSENRSYIQLEIGSGTLYMMNGWQLSGWRRDRQDIALTDVVRGRFVVLRKGNDSIAVLYWTMRLMFRVGSVFSTRNVGVSVFSIFTEPITESKILEVRAEFRRVGISIINWWDYVSRWTLHLYTLREIYVRFRDVFFTVVGVVAVFAFAGWVRAKDEKVERLVENSFVLMEEEATLLVAISGMKRRVFLGKELFEAYRRIAESEVDLKGFYDRLTRISMFGLIGKDHVLMNGQLVMVWKSFFS